MHNYRRRIGKVVKLVSTRYEVTSTTISQYPASKSGTITFGSGTHIYTNSALKATVYYTRYDTYSDGTVKTTSIPVSFTRTPCICYTSGSNSILAGIDYQEGSVYGVNSNYISQTRGHISGYDGYTDYFGINTADATGFVNKTYIAITSYGGSVTGSASKQIGTVTFKKISDTTASYSFSPG